MDEDKNHKTIFMPLTVYNRLGRHAALLCTTTTPVSRQTLARYCIAKSMPEVFNTLTSPPEAAKIQQYAANIKMSSTTRMMTSIDMPTEWMEGYDGGQLGRVSYALGNDITRGDIAAYLIDQGITSLEKFLGSKPSPKKLATVRRDMRSMPLVMNPHSPNT